MQLTATEVSDLIKKKIEKFATQKGSAEVTPELMQEAKAALM